MAINGRNRIPPCRHLTPTIIRTEGHCCCRLVIGVIHYAVPAPVTAGSSFYLGLSKSLLQLGKASGMRFKGRPGSLSSADLYHENDAHGPARQIPLESLAVTVIWNTCLSYV